MFNPHGYYMHAYWEGELSMPPRIVLMFPSHWCSATCTFSGVIWSSGICLWNKNQLNCMTRGPSHAEDNNLVRRKEEAQLMCCREGDMWRGRLCVGEREWWSTVLFQFVHGLVVSFRRLWRTEWLKMERRRTYSYFSVDLFTFGDDHVTPMTSHKDIPLTIDSPLNRFVHFNLSTRVFFVDFCVRVLLLFVSVLYLFYYVYFVSNISKY